MEEKLENIFEASHCYTQLQPFRRPNHNHHQHHHPHRRQIASKALLIPGVCRSLRQGRCYLLFTALLIGPLESYVTVTRYLPFLFPLLSLFSSLYFFLHSFLAVYYFHHSFFPFSSVSCHEYFTSPYRRKNFLGHVSFLWCRSLSEILLHWFMEWVV